MSSLNRKELLKAFAPVIVCVVISVSIFVCLAVMSGFHKERLAAMDDEISAMQRKVNAAEAEAQLGDKDLTKAVTGIDLDRVAKDDQKAESFLKKTFSWDDLDSYHAKREELMEEYGLSEDSPFMTAFMPNIGTVKDRDGNEYQRENVNIVKTEYEDMSSRVVAVSGDRYTYFTEVTLKVEDESRPGSEGSALCVFGYSVDGDGNLSDLSGYTVVDVQRGK